MEQLIEQIKQEYSKWSEPSSKQYVIHIGPTNSGKTYNAVQKLKQSRSGVYLAPLRLLAWEIYDKLTSEQYNCSLITGEEKIINKDANYICSTIEMLNNSKHYEVAVIDECFMIADSQRGKHWLKAIMEVDADEIHIITNIEAAGLIINLLEQCNQSYIKYQYERKTPLKVVDKVYEEIPNKSILVVFSRISVLYYKMIFTKLRKKVSILYGNLPPEVKKEQIRLFVSGETDIIISTDVIGMGINLPCDHVIFLEGTKFDGEETRQLTPKEIKQIGGRAGRFGMSEVGYIGTTDITFMETLKLGIKNTKKDKTGIFGLTLEIYKVLPSNLPTERIKIFKDIVEKILPDNLNELLMCEDMKVYEELSSYYDLKYIEDINLNWALLNCPVNKLNKEYWEYVISTISHNRKCYFNILYDLEPITSIVNLEDAEINIAVIDLFLYMLNNNKISKYFYSEAPEFSEKIIEHKNIIINNINTFLVEKKIKQNEFKKTLKSKF